MPRKTNKRIIEVFGEKVVCHEQYYLNNPSLPVKAEYSYTPAMAEALDRCRNDIVYFAEHFFTIIDASVRKKIPLRDYQKRILRSMQHDKRLILLFSRQTGKTTLMSIYALWKAMFFPDQSIRIIAHVQERAVDDLDRVNLAYQEMDNWVKQCVAEGEWNKTKIKFANGSSISALATSASAGRGDTVSCLLLDELAFVEEGIAQEFWRSVGPTLKSNPNAQLFIASTPKGEGNLLWELCTKADKKENDYKIERVYWYDVPGRDQQWKDDVIKNDCNGDIDYFEQEYECRFLGANNSPFPQEVFDFLYKTIRPPLEDLDNGYLQIWKYPENHRIYTIGVDISEGLGKDYSVIQVFDITDLEKIEQCACYYNNTINTLDFTPKIYEIAEMYGKPVLSVERNGCGTDVCNKLALDYNYPRFVNYGTNSLINSKYSGTFRWGIINSQNTRSPAVNNFKYWLADKKRVYIYDQRFLEELRHFEFHPINRRWAAASGYHDDLIMSTTWALNVLHRNLVNTYFIVEKWDSANRTVPLALTNKFKYELDEEESKKLLTIKYGNGGLYKLPAAVFGMHDRPKLTEEEIEEKRRAAGGWYCFLDEGEPLYPAQNIANTPFMPGFNPYGQTIAPHPKDSGLFGQKNPYRYQTR